MATDTLVDIINCIECDGNCAQPSEGDQASDEFVWEMFIRKSMVIGILGSNGQSPPNA